MKGFALLVAVLAGAALLYVTTAIGGQQAGPSRAEFNTLKKQVAALKRDDTAIQAVLGACLTRGVPVLQYVGYEVRAADGTTVVDTALDLAALADTPTMYLLDVGQVCAQAINTTKLNLHGFKLVRPKATQR